MNDRVDDTDARRFRLEQLKSHFLPGQHARANAMFAFHGCSEEIAKKIARFGAARLAGVDDGYFGSGIYLTPHAEYAMGYATGQLTPSIVAHAAGMPGVYVMLLCYVGVGNTYPITRESDYLVPARADFAGSDSEFWQVSLSQFHYKYPVRTISELVSAPTHPKSIKARFDSHYVRVSREQNWQASIDMEIGDYGEIVVGNSPSVLPYCLVYFGADDPRPPQPAPPLEPFSPRGEMLNKAREVGSITLWWWLLSRGCVFCHGCVLLCDLSWVELWTRVVCRL